MNKNRKRMTEGILNITLEILHLLTGEHYIVVKKISDEDEGWSRNQESVMKPPVPSLINERINEQKVLEITNMVIHLLTGEVHMRCRDVAVYFTMEEWEYIERHKDLYKDVMMADHRNHTSPERSSMRKTSGKTTASIYSQDFPEGNHKVEGLTDIKVEVRAIKEKNYVRCDQQCKGEEIPTDINTLQNPPGLLSPHSFLYKTIVFSLASPWNNGRNKMAERIINLFMEVVYLLTGDDYAVVQRISGECSTSTSRPHLSGGSSRTQIAITDPPPHLLIHERKNKILELTNKIVHLLTGEVPIRCQDVTVYFSMEEWEYIEGHQDLYRDAMMENHQTPSPGLRDLYKDVMMEDHRPLTSPDDCTKLGHPLFPDYEAELKDIPYHTSGEYSITPNIPSHLYSRDLSSDPTTHKETSSDQSQTITQDKGHVLNVENIIKLYVTFPCT
ncbi:uncharacterized protein LOC142663729 isoform X2 [Rhinoderma darwinii]|uniref:uncharacterized protein LOC142663729 isoform X2 n=1 Tax=Rhinoderma darwinii TaxID=43563 RepID=UPI003F673FC3